MYRPRAHRTRLLLRPPSDTVQRRDNGGSQGNGASVNFPDLANPADSNPGQGNAKGKGQGLGLVVAPGLVIAPGLVVAPGLVDSSEATSLESSSSTASSSTSSSSTSSSSTSSSSTSSSSTSSSSTRSSSTRSSSTRSSSTSSSSTSSSTSESTASSSQVTSTSLSSISTSSSTTLETALPPTSETVLPSSSETGVQAPPTVPTSVPPTSKTGTGTVSTDPATIEAPALVRQQDHGLSVGQAAGVSIGSIASFLLAVTLILFVLRRRSSRDSGSKSLPHHIPRRRRRRRQQQQQQQHHLDPSPHPQSPTDSLARAKWANPLSALENNSAVAKPRPTTFVSRWIGQIRNSQFSSSSGNNNHEINKLPVPLPATPAIVVSSNTTEGGDNSPVSDRFSFLTSTAATRRQTASSFGPVTPLRYPRLPTALQQQLEQQQPDRGPPPREPATDIITRTISVTSRTPTSPSSPSSGGGDGVRDKAQPPPQQLPVIVPLSPMARLSKASGLGG